MGLVFFNTSQAQENLVPVISDLDHRFLIVYQQVTKSPSQAESFINDHRDYVLAPLLESLLIQQHLKQNTLGMDQKRQEVLSFISRYRNTFAAQRLLSDWLLWLDKKQAYTLFINDYNANPPAISSDALFCANQRALLETNNTSQPTQINYVLSSAKRLSEDSCVNLVSRWAGASLLDQNQLIKALFLLTEQGDLQGINQLNRELPLSLQMNGSRLQSAFSANAKQLKTLSTQSLPEQLLLGITLIRLANKDPNQAWAHLLQYPGLSNTIRSYVLAQIGVELMQRGEMSAYQYFEQGTPNGLSDETLEYRWRAFLIANNQQPDYLQLMQTIEQLSAEKRLDPAVQYWFAIATGPLEKNQQKTTQLLKNLVQSDDFYYGWLAKEQLGDAVSCHQPPPQNTQTFIGEADSRLPEHITQGMWRVKKLLDLNLNIEGAREWMFMLRQMNAEQALQMGLWAEKYNLFSRSIAAGERAKFHINAMRLRYPVLYQSSIAPNAAAQNIPSAWVLGLMRQESRFTETISSSVGARGLMQIMPATGRWLAKQKGLRDFSTASLNQPAVNIELGTFYMRQLLDEFSGSFVLATAAYNAGPGRPRKWSRELTRPIAAHFFIEHIPFSETRNYVKSVLSNAACYQSLLEKQPIKLSKWLGEITVQ